MSDDPTRDPAPSARPKSPSDAPSLIDAEVSRQMARGEVPHAESGTADP